MSKTWSCDGGSKQWDEEAEERDILNRVLNSESEKKNQYPFFFLIKNMEISRASQVEPGVKNLLANAGDTSDAGSLPGLEDPLEEGMAIHSSILAWRESHGQRSLVGYGPRGRKESDTTEGT